MAFWKKGLGSGFGAVILALEKLMGFVPSYLSAFLFIASSSITPKSKFFESLKLLWDKKKNSPYEQGGIALKAMSWSLNITLGGPVEHLKGDKLLCEWVGPEGSSAQVNYKNLGRSIWIHVFSTIIFILALLCAYIYAGKFF